MTYSTALEDLGARLQDPKRLVEIHEECTGVDRGRRVGYDTLNRSAVMLTVAAWEGFVEQTVMDAAKAISDDVAGPSVIPTRVRDALLAHLYQQKGWASLQKTSKESMWALAGRGWRKVYLEYVAAKTRALNTPNFENVAKIYATTMGLDDFASHWGATRWSVGDYRQKLENALNLRHQIAHGAIGHTTVGKTKARDTIALVERIAGWTDRSVREHVKALVKPKKKKASS